MNEYYPRKQSISAKSDEWLAALEIPDSRLARFRFNPENSALLIIDMQDFFLKEESHAFLPAARAITANINSVVERFRKRNHPVIFTYHALEEDEEPGLMGRWWGDVLKADDPLSRIHSSVDWQSDDITIRKSRYGAFTGTILDRTLEDMGIKSLVVTGIMTHLCCESTAREAFMRDYEVYFVIDATATRSEKLHFSSIRALADGFAVPVKTDSILYAVG